MRVPNPGQLRTTLEFLIIVYTRNMFFDKISLLHAVIRALHDFRRGASRGAIFFFFAQKIFENLVVKL